MMMLGLRSNVYDGDDVLCMFVGTTVLLHLFYLYFYVAGETIYQVVHTMVQNTVA